MSEIIVNEWALQQAIKYHASHLGLKPTDRIKGGIKEYLLHLPRDGDSGGSGEKK